MHLLTLKQFNIFFINLRLALINYLIYFKIKRVKYETNNKAKFWSFQ